MGPLKARCRGDSLVLMYPDTGYNSRSFVAKLKSNGTKEEIDSFRKGQIRKLQIECDEPNGEEPIKSPISPLSPFFKESPRKTRKWKSIEKESKHPPISSTSVDSPVGGEKDNENRHWWKRSNWAYLNEPPIDDMIKKTSGNAAQLDVAKMASSTSI